MSNSLCSIFCLFLLSFFDGGGPWIREAQDLYTFYYQAPDQGNAATYKQLIVTGVVSVKDFFLKPFPKAFDVYVHPNRQSWDKKLQEAYKMPDFKSECWMVASGDAFQLNMISPATWDTAACEHKYGNKEETQRLLTHELFHVFHGQHNASPDFSELEGLDWLAEGFATYASGQLSSKRKEDIRALLAANAAPAELDNFWKGQHRYALSGSVVQYIDGRYGREMLFRILAFNKKSDVLATLKISEAELIAGWKIAAAK